MPKYDNQNAKGLQNLGFNYGKPIGIGVCAICRQTLVVKVVCSTDLHCCDRCGRIYCEGASGLLVQIGETAKCRNAESTSAES